MAKKKRQASRTTSGRSAARSKRQARKAARTPDQEKQPTSLAPTQATSLPFAVVGIGASAGGLNAFKKFLSAMPADSGMAFVLIPHLDPTHESLMVELLAKQTTMPVVEAVDRTPVQPNCVYIIPPNRYLAISDGVLELSRPSAPRGLQTAIDVFLRSLAEDQHEKAIGIVLSGTGSHGTRGLKEIKLAGGLIMVQEPKSAEYDQMPRSAISTGLVDYVLPPEQMPEALLKYIEQPYLNHTGEPVPPAEETAEYLSRILAALRARSKYDFRSYRKNMLLRRVQRRMGLCHIDQFTEYLDYLRENPDEVMALYKDLLIGVTGFFREPEAFQVLVQRVVPDLVRRAGADLPVRVWVPGCATGEEAYSIGIVFFEQFAAKGESPNLQIFATDIDEGSLEVARNGIYPGSIAGDLSPERLRRFFVKTDDDHFQVNKQLRESIVFAPQNLISDAPFSKLDLISCRNVLIYLEPDVQAKVIALFHFALVEDGYLLLGPAESIGRAIDLFDPVSKKWRIYRRIGPLRRELVEIPIVATDRRLHLPRAEAAPPRPTLGFGELMQKALLEEFAPASVLVNRRFEVLCFQGPTVNYLEFPPGEPTRDVLALARPGLRTKVRAACQKASRERAGVTDADARVNRNGTFVACTISVRPFVEPKEAEGLFLVTFQDRPAAPPQGRSKKGRARVQATEESKLVEQLEYELKTTREDLQSTIEEMESSNEELKASNEEVMSMNEELQSANEELETSKEELQSLNEELSTVNNQLQDKLEELDKTNNDMVNLLNSTDIAVVFLDAEMRIQRFTPAIGRLLNVMATDVGRPITDFSAKFRDEAMLLDARRVLETLSPVEREIQADDGHWHMLRILPYRTQDNRIEGVVAAFVDFSRRKCAEEALHKLNEELEQRVAQRSAELTARNERYRAMVETSGAVILVLEPDFRILEWNAAAEQVFGYKRDEVIGRDYADLFLPENVREEVVGAAKQVLGGLAIEAYENPVKTRDGTLRTVLWNAAPLLDGPSVVGLIAIGQDITDRKRAVVALRDSEAQMRAIVETAADAIITSDQRGIVRSFNPGAERMFGYQAEEIIGQNACVLMPSPYREEHDEYVARYLKTGEARIIGIGREVIGRRRDGTTFPIDLAVSEFRDETERFFTAIIRDITDRKQAQEQLLQSERLAAIGEAMAGLAHESRNALQRAQANLGMLAKQVEGQPEAEELIERIEAAQDHLNAIYEEVREYAAPIRLQLESHDVGAVARQAWENLSARRAGRTAQWREDGNDVDLQCKVDAPAMERVFRNILENALDACRDPVELEVEYSQSELAGRPALRIAVRDNGPGLTAEARERIFDSFYTTKTHGTGLGMAIAKRIVHAHGGTVGVGPDQRGAQIVVTLPRSTP